jgi:WD40 repeat protein
MPIPLPNLDDRQFADLTAEMQARIARYAPEWTNHNIADPGIMLLELFAWQTEAFIYRINRVPDQSRIRFLQMLGGLFEPAQPAIVKFMLKAPQIAGPWTLPRDTVLTSRPHIAGEVLFETLRDVTLTKPLKEGAIAALEGHTSGVLSAEFNHAGSRIITASRDGTARLWNGEGAFLAALEGHTRDVNSATFNHDGSRIVTTSVDNTARLWNGEGAFLAAFEGHTGDVNSATFNHDGSRIVTTSVDNTARLWDGKGASLGTLDGHTDVVYSAAFNHDGSRIITASRDGKARLWNGDGTFFTALEGHTRDVNSAAFNHDGSRIVTASRDNTARLWDGDGTFFTALEGHTRDVNSAAFNHDGSRIITASRDGTARLWDGDGAFFTALEGHTRDVNSAAFNHDGSRIVTSSRDNTARLWDGEGAFLAALEGHTRDVNSATFNHDGSRIITASRDRMARLWDGEGAFIAYVTARQTVLVKEERLGISNGTSFQLFELAQPFIVLPDTPPPVLPKVDVSGEQWTYRPNFSESESGDKHFTIKVWLNAVAFGDGERGLKPSKGAKITVSYRHAPTRSGITKEEFDSNGKPYQYYRLQEKLLARDLKQPSVLEPLVMVKRENEENGELWQYRARVTDMAADAHEFMVEPARNSIRFGNGDYGGVPPAGAEIRVMYRYTQRPLTAIPPHSNFFIANPQVDNPAPANLVIEFDQVIASGSDATDIDEAHTRAHDILKPRWRAISTNDFETIVENSDFDVARTRCLPGRNVDVPGDGKGSTGHVSVVVVPEARHIFDLQTHELVEVLGFGPSGSCVVGLDSDGKGWLVLLENQNERIDLGLFKKEAVRQVAFSPSRESLITTGDDNVPILRSTRSGQELAEFLVGSALEFSPTGAYIGEIADSGEAFLWDARDATIIFPLSQENLVKSVVFGADDRLVATSSAESGNNDVHLWDAAGGVYYGALSHSGQVVAMVFTPDGEQLITAVEDGEIFLWQTKNARLRAKIFHDQAIRDLIVSGDGTRLVTHDGRQAWLWSTRSRRKMVHSTLGTDIVAIHFSPDSNWLVVTHEDGVIDLWDAKRGDDIGSFDHGATIQQLAFSPNSQRLVTLSNEPYTLLLWDLRTARDKFSPKEIGSDLTAAALSEDGSWFCYADDNLLRLWSTEEMKQISVLYHDHTHLHHDHTHGPITEVQGIRHGKYLYVVSKDQNDKGLIHIWNANHVPDVYHLVNDRRLVTSVLHVAGPTYTDVYVEAKIAPSQHPKTQDQLRQDAVGALYEFFHPLRGGPDGKGWPWGRDVYATEIYQILEGVEGVDHVELLSLHRPGAHPDSEKPVEKGGMTFISIPPFHLVNFVVDQTVFTFTG